MLPFKIAYRFLKNRKGQTFLIASAVAIGISIQIFLGLLIQNLQSGLIETTIGETSHITLKSKDNSVIKNGSEINNLLMKSDSKIVTSLEVLDRPGLILNKNTSTSVLIRSFDLEQGDKIYILTPSNEKIEFTVSGILDLKVKALNKNYVVTNIDTLRDVYKLPNDSITSIETQLSNKDIFEAENVAQSIKDSVGSDFLVDNWINENESLLSGLKGQSASSYTIQVFIVISVLVAIASILAITVLQKTNRYIKGNGNNR